MGHAAKSTWGSATWGSAIDSIDVIVVEDEDDSLAMFEALLATHGCAPRCFSSAEAGFESALARAPEVVITDLHLTGVVTGWSMAELLRKEPRTRSIALIAVSGVIDPHPEILAPFDAYIRKPIDTLDLVELVHRLSRTSHERRERARAARWGGTELG